MNIWQEPFLPVKLEYVFPSGVSPSDMHFKCIKCKHVFRFSYVCSEPFQLCPWCGRPNTLEAVANPTKFGVIYAKRVISSAGPIEPPPRKPATCSIRPHLELDKCVPYVLHTPPSEADEKSFCHVEEVQRRYIDVLTKDVSNGDAKLSVPHKSSLSPESKVWLPIGDELWTCAEIETLLSPKSGVAPSQANIILTSSLRHNLHQNASPQQIITSLQGRKKMPYASDSTGTLSSSTTIFHYKQR